APPPPQRAQARRTPAPTAQLTAANAALDPKVEALAAARRIRRATRDTAKQAGTHGARGPLAAGSAPALQQPLAASRTVA
ncbi:histidine kinase, partial [Burkholderia pseudomallei]